MLHFYVMRHGEAGPHASKDSLRQLTQRGIAQVHATCSQFAEIKQIDFLYASPYTRASQSADIVAGYAGVEPHECACITPSSAVETAIQYFYEKHHTHEGARIMIASHMPFVSSLISQLADVSPYSSGMNTAALAYLSGEVFASGCCELHWIHSP